MPHQESGIAGLQPGGQVGGDADLVGHPTEMIHGFGHARVRQEARKPFPWVVVTGLLGVLGQHDRHDVALDPRRRHVVPNTGAVNGRRETPLRVEDDLRAVVEDGVLGDSEVSLPWSLTLQLTKSTEAHDSHVPFCNDTPLATP